MGITLQNSNDLKTTRTPLDFLATFASWRRKNHTMPLKNSKKLQKTLNRKLTCETTNYEESTEKLPKIIPGLTSNFCVGQGLQTKRLIFNQKEITRVRRILVNEPRENYKNFASILWVFS